MKGYEKLPKAVQDCHELLAWIIPQLDKFPRPRRFTLGERIESGLLEVLEWLVEGAYSRSKAEILRHANLRLDRVRHLWRLGHELKAVSAKSYAHGVKMMEALGRQIGGWQQQASGRGRVMKRIGGLWEPLVSFDNLYLAWRKARLGKANRPAVARFALDLEHNLLHLQQQLIDRTYQPDGYRLFTIYDRKPRNIAAAPFHDRVVHHALMNKTMKRTTTLVFGSPDRPQPRPESRVSRNPGACQRVSMASLPVLRRDSGRQRELQGVRALGAGRLVSLDAGRRPWAFLILFTMVLGLIGNEVRAQDESVGTEPIRPSSPPTLDPSPCEIIDGEGPQMVVIAAGTFQIGSPQSETGRASNEGPQHPVAVVRPFALSRCEISVGQFFRFVDETGYRTDAERGEGCFVLNEKSSSSEQRKDRNWRDPGFSQGEEHPVVCVSWNDANVYAEWLSARTDHAYRLPSEAEWEYAARGGSQQSRFWGDDPEQACEYANGADQALTQRFYDWQYSASNCNDGVVFTARTGRYRRNIFGLSDMLGNAWEWTADCWHQNYEGAPNDGSTWDLGGDCALRVVRGGGWDNGPGYLRSANRDGFTADGANDNLGFRLARTL